METAPPPPSPSPYTILSLNTQFSKNTNLLLVYTEIEPPLIEAVLFIKFESVILILKFCL